MFLFGKFWKFPEVSPLLYSNRPNPNERRELKCSFIFTKDNLKVLEHSTSRIGEKETDHWAITAQLSPAAQDRSEVNIYDSNNLEKLERTMAGRSSSPRTRKVTSSTLDVCSLPDQNSISETSSTENEDKIALARKKKISLKISKQGGSNVFVDDDILSPNRRVLCFI